MNNYFSKNLKKLRELNGYSQSELSRITQRICEEYNKNVDEKDKITPITQASIARWELGENSPSVDNIVLLKNALKVELVDLIGKDLNFDNASFIETKSDNDTVQIPVLGVIKAGTPIEAQENIIDYVDIPKDWLRGDKKFFGLKISGNSMFPKYIPGDTVIFEATEDFESANNKDCCVMVNGFNATFKKFNLNQNGITLTPLNLDNEDGYLPTFYNIEQIQNMPVKVIGIARRRISDIE